MSTETDVEQQLETDNKTPAAISGAEKITMWERKLLDLDLRNQLINMRLTKKVIPLFVSSLSDLEDKLSEGKDFVIQGRNVPDEEEKKEEAVGTETSETEAVSEGEQASESADKPAETPAAEKKQTGIPAKEYTFENMHDLTGFEDEIRKAYEKNKLISSITRADLDDRVKDLYRSAKSSLEENGANTLYIALGLLKWYEQDGEKACHYAPLVLVPIDLVRRSLALGYVIRIREEDPMLNISILEKLKAEFDIRIDGLDELPLDDSGTDLNGVFERVREGIRVKDNWEVLESAYIGIFSFTQFVMWNDLKTRRDELRKNNVVNSLIEGYLTWECEPMETDVYQDESGIMLPMQADASQLCAIRAAKEGKSFVLHGPPGTGKSQTITSMIANLLYDGKKVLFAAEKKAALEVVYNRLGKIGLAPFCLELHSNKARKRDVLEQLRIVSEIAVKGDSEAYLKRSQEMHDKRVALDQYVNELHAVGGSGYSLFELISIYEKTKDAPDIEPFDDQTINDLKKDDIENIKTELMRLIDIGREYKSDEAAKTLTFVKSTEYSQSMREDVPSRVTAYENALDDLRSKASGKSIDAIKESIVWYNEGLKTAAARDEILSSWDKDFFGEDPRALLKEYKAAEDKWAIMKTMAINAVYKKVSMYDLHKAHKADLKEQLEKLQAYKEMESIHPIVAESDYIASYNEALKARESLSDLIKLDGELNDIDKDISMCGVLRDNSTALKNRIQYNREISVLLGLGARNLTKAYDEGTVTEAQLADALEKAYSRKLIIKTIDASDVLKNFSGTVFESSIEQYKKLNDEYTELTKQEIYYKLASRIPDFTKVGLPSSELGKLKKAIASGGRGTSLRKLFSEIPNLLRELCPCMLMSPISVAQYLELKDFKFDAVIFDEASQLPTCKAVGVLARGDSAVIVGDPKQMPPTSFFMSEHLDEENIEIEDLESILDDCLALNMPQTHLRWHYRSRHESLIEFSNKAFYENRLYTFPSSNDLTSKVTFVRLDGIFDRGRTRTNQKEAEAVVEDIVRRFKDPELKKQSIGVVTFNINQQNKIDDLLQEACKKDPELESWAYSSEEPIFIKNLENVQGDERDVILFSVGYGTDETGSVYMNFGPLNKDGGWRRLNVAVTRSRYEMKVFSSMGPEQIRNASSSSRGVQAMRRFLEYASGSTVWETGLEDTYAADSDGGSAPLIDRDAEFTGAADYIISALEDKGYKCVKAVGKSGYKIDIGVVDKENDGIYTAGIMIDGATYKNAKSTRDREVAQKSVLEGLGWRIMRVWSVDLWEDPEKVISRVIDFIEKKDIPVEVPAAETAPEAEVPEENGDEVTAASEAETSAPITEDRDILVPYVKVSLPVSEMTADEFYSAGMTETLAEKVWRILEAESPISKELIARRLAESCLLSRVTDKVRDRVEYLCGLKRFKYTKYDDRRYYWSEDRTPENYKLIRYAEDATTRRDHTDLPVEEAMNAVVYTVKSQVGLPEADIPSEAAKIMGYSRPTDNIKAVFKDALDMALEEGLLSRGVGDNIVAV